MSYQKKIDEMVGKYVADFQLEVALAKKLENQVYKPPMPYGYPVPVYHPIHICRTPRVKHFIAQTGGRMSNGVPRVLGMDFVDGYLLGIYHSHVA